MQMLSWTLKHLEQDGFILRTIYPEVPPRVEYCLTELGRSFLVTMQTLIGWRTPTTGPSVKRVESTAGKIETVVI